jgi:hypothetical protein
MVMLSGTGAVVWTKRCAEKRLSHPLDDEVKTLYSPPPCCSQVQRIQRQPITQEFIVKRQGHIANRSLPLSGQCAFVRAGFYRAMAVVTMNERHPAKGQRPTGSLGDEDRMHPGTGGA